MVNAKNDQCYFFEMQDNRKTTDSKTYCAVVKVDINSLHLTVQMPGFCALKKGDLDASFQNLFHH